MTTTKTRSSTYRSINYIALRRHPGIATTKVKLAKCPVAMESATVNQNARMNGIAKTTKKILNTTTVKKTINGYIKAWCVTESAIV